MEPESSPPTPKQIWQVEREIRCVRCGFDLRGHRIDAECPECGTPVAVSCSAPAASGHAIASMVLGIVSIITCMAYGLPTLVCGILALVFASSAKTNILKGKASASSLGMAKAGFICGVIGLATVVVWIAIVLFFALAGMAA